MKKLFVVLISLYSFPLLALGETGHRITGAIAEKYLTETSRKAIAELIDNQSLAEASTFADEMRSSNDPFWSKVAYPYHFITIPKGKTYLEVGAPKQGDAVFALDKYSKILRDNKASKTDKTIAVKMITHIIGDLHQPLHVGNGLDRGGNDVKLKYFGQHTNLHSVWDSGMIDGSTLSYTEWTAFLYNSINDEDFKKWYEPDPQVWILESAKIRDSIYPKKTDIPKDSKLASLGYLYKFDHLPILKMRIKQAGIRMAAYFNDIFDDKH